MVIFSPPCIPTNSFPDMFLIRSLPVQSYCIPDFLNTFMSTWKVHIPVVPFSSFLLGKNYILWTQIDDHFYKDSLQSPFIRASASLIMAWHADNIKIYCAHICLPPCAKIKALISPTLVTNTIRISLMNYDCNYDLMISLSIKYREWDPPCPNT